MSWRCPNGCEVFLAVVCGGEGPYYNHADAARRERYGRQDEVLPNVYFYVGADGTDTHQALDADLPFTLTDEDWADMRGHAAGGCRREPQCSVCSAYLEETP